jgi:hypothetical protein
LLGRAITELPSRVLNPLEYLKSVQGFGTWRIAYDPAAKKWPLSCNVHIKGERWEPVSHFDVAEAAAVVVGERRTGFSNWDKLGFAPRMNFDLSNWKTEASEGDAGDDVGD